MKKSFPAVAVLILLLLSNSVEADLVGNGAFEIGGLMFHFDETGGALASDSSDNNNQGALNNMSDDNWVGGAYNNALEFNGTDNYVSVPDDPTLDKSGSLIIDVWVYQSSRSVSVEAPVVVKGDNYQLAIREDGTVSLWLRCNSSNYNTVSSDVVPLNSWTRLQAVYSALDPNHKAYLYINGSETGYLAQPGLPSPYTLDPNNDPLYVGAYPGVRYFDGLIDELCITEGSLGGPAATESIWNFDESSGAVAADSSANGNDGVLNNMSDIDWVPGHSGNALDFDGVDDYVAVADDSTLDFTDELNIDVWIYQHTRISSGAARIAAKGNVWELDILWDGSITFWISSANAFYRTDSTGNYVPLNQWVHLQATYSSTDPAHKPRLYMNGSEVTYAQQATVPAPYTIDTNSDELWIGGYPPVSKYYDGLIDELRISGIASQSSDYGGTPSGWSTVTDYGSPGFHWSSSSAHTGIRSISITCPNQSSKGRWRKYVNVSSYTPYVISFYYQQQPAGRRAQVQFLGSTFWLGVASDWVEFRRVLYSGGSSGSRNIDLLFLPIDNSSGSCWFDDVKIEPGYVDLKGPVSGSTPDNTPTFQWNSNFGTDFAAYTLQYAPDPTFSTGVTTVEELREHSYTPSAPLANGAWYWRVTAYGYDEWESAPVTLTSATASFTINNSGTDLTDPAIDDYPTRIASSLPAVLVVTYSDNTSIDVSSVRFEINGVDKTDSAAVSPTGLQFSVEKALIDFNKVFVYDQSAGTYADYTVPTSGESGIAPFAQGTSDKLYLGKDIPFRMIHFQLSTWANTAVGPSVAYWNGSSWADVPGMTDTTRAMLSDGTIIFALPGDWQQNAVNGENMFWIRITNAAAAGIGPVAQCISSGIFEAVITVADASGNIAAKTWDFAVKAAPDSGIVTLNADKTISVDGAKFFRAGMYRSRLGAQDTNYDDFFSELSSAGFNTVHRYMTGNYQLLPYLDDASRYGLKMFAVQLDNYNSYIDMGQETGVMLDGVRASVFDLMNHPALLSYYMVDEPEVHGIGARRLERIHQAVKEIDPYHVTNMVVGGDGSLAYRAGADIFSSDIYPITGQRITRVLEEVDQTVTNVGAEKSVGYVVQMYQRTDYSPVRWPTPEEERNMTYQSIIHGGAGVMYYVYRGAVDSKYIKTNPSLWVYMKSLAAELRDLSPVILSVDSARQVTCNEPTVDFILKHYNGREYLLTVNRDYQYSGGTYSGISHNGVTFTLSPGNAATVKAVYEFSGGDRVLTVSGGSQFTDDFAPYEVHVYEITYSVNDSDFDGMPDSWEYDHGLNPFQADDSFDSDTDGMTNYEEYVADTDPWNKLDLFEAEISYDHSSGSIAFSWAGKSTRQYSLYRSDDMQLWMEVPGWQAVYGNDSVLTYSESITGTGKIFYKCSVSLP